MSEQQDAAKTTRAERDQTALELLARYSRDPAMKKHYQARYDATYPDANRGGTPWPKAEPKPVPNWVGPLGATLVLGAIMLVVYLIGVLQR